MNERMREKIQNIEQTIFHKPEKWLSEFLCFYFGVVILLDVWRWQCIGRKFWNRDRVSEREIERVGEWELLDDTMPVHFQKIWMCAFMCSMMAYIKWDIPFCFIFYLFTCYTIFYKHIGGNRIAVVLCLILLYTFENAQSKYNIELWWCSQTIQLISFTR